MNKVIFKSTYKIDKTTKINHYVLLNILILSYIFIMFVNICKCFHLLNNFKNLKKFYISSSLPLIER